MANILNSPSKYVQGAGELSRLGKYAEGYGKKALILISASGYKRIGSMVEESFSGTGCSTIFDYFNGECCKTEINRLIEVMEKEGCDMVIGIGGGKILDTSKAVAYYRHTPVTSARPSLPRMRLAARFPLSIRKTAFLRSICSFRPILIWF